MLETRPKRQLASGLDKAHRGCRAGAIPAAPFSPVYGFYGFIQGNMLLFTQKAAQAVLGRYAPGREEHTLKALSIHPEYVMQILNKTKTIEYRSWRTHYRGDILICSTAKKKKGTVSGHAMCVVSLDDVREGRYDYEWQISNVRYIRPIPLKGKLSLWTYDGDIEYITEQEAREIWETLKA